MKTDVKALIDAGVHFGHEKRKWDPKMAPYILCERNGVYIIDIRQTAQNLDRACDFLRRVGASGKGVLFVGTKKQAQRAVVDAAERCGMYYVRQRWLGGTLTNFVTIKKSIDRLRTMEAQIESGDMEKLSKKDQSRFTREFKRLEKSLGGIKSMVDLPQALVVIDTQREKIAIQEANRLNIPVVGIVDTKCNPDPVDYVIPANDDAIKSAKVLFTLLSDAVWEGRQKYLKEAGLPLDVPVVVKTVLPGTEEDMEVSDAADPESEGVGVVVKSVQDAVSEKVKSKEPAAGREKSEEWE